MGLKHWFRFDLVKFHIIAGTLLLVTACGGGGGGSQDPDGNVTLTSLRVLTPSPEISYPITLEVGVESDTEGDSVSVTLFAAEKGDDPEAETRQIPLGSATVSDVVSGGGPYEIEINVPSSVEVAGEYYLIAIADAADDRLETDEEDNTYTTEVTLAEPFVPNILISDFTLDRASLEISTLSFEDHVNELQGNVYNADASATLTVGSDGLKVDETVDIEAYARLKISRSDKATTHEIPLYLWNSDEQRYINAYGVDPSGNSIVTQAEWLPLGTFVPQLVTQGSEADGVVTPDGVTVEDVGRDSTLMSYYFPGKLGSELALAMRYQCTVNDGGIIVFGDPPPIEPTIPPPDLTAEAINDLKAFLAGYPKDANCDVYTNEELAMAVTDFELCVEIRTPDGALGDRVPDDNEECSALAITLPPVESTILPTPDLDGYSPVYSTPANALKNGVGFDTKGGGSVFSFGVNFGNYASADNRGYIETISAAVPVTIFGVSFDYVSIDLRAQLVPDYEGKPAQDKNEISLEVRHVGQMLTSWVTVPPGEEDFPLTGVEISIDKVDELYSFSKEYPDPDKDRLLESTFFVGPVPMSAGAYVTGSLGVQFGTADQNLNPIKFTSADSYSLGTSITPKASLDATMYGGFGSRKAIIAGVEGVLTLLSEELEFFYGIDIDLINDGVGSDPAEFVISQGPIITNTFTGPQGRINLFAEFPVLKFKTCKIGFIKVRCPAFVRVKVKKNIFTSPAAFEFVDVLYEDPSVVLDVVLLDGEEPQYFTPGPGE
ncbi:MAG: hypothetical protein AAF434_05385 [Pseudomonadota bacterium]